MTAIAKYIYRRLDKTQSIIHYRTCRKMSSRIEDTNVMTEPTSGKHTGTVFFLHGSGATGPSIKEWVEMLKRDASFSHLKIKYPTAAKRPYTPLGGETSNVWFDRIKINPFSPDHLETLNPMGEKLTELIKKEVENGIPLNRIIVGGFSMGGSMAMHLGYRFLPDVAGVFVLASFLAEDSIIYKDLKLKKNLKLPPLFYAHGETDDLVDIKWGQETFKRLQELGIEGEFHPIPNTYHQLQKKELNMLFDWINKIVPNNI